MKPRLLLALASLAVLSLQAEPARHSPDIEPDNSVTFQIRAPQAHEVTVQGQWPDGKISMQKETNGWWSVTSAPIPAGIWEYSLQVDGLSMIDPGNSAIKPMREPRTSILHIPGNPPLPWDFQDVPHGVVHSHTYRSKSLGVLRGLVVYTPPGYEQNNRKYPTLYLQHGSGDNQATWTVHGKAHWILDNLIAQGRTKPMIVVMANGHTSDQPFSMPGLESNAARFERDLLEDVMPFVEANYRVKKSAEDRAVAGLSMGGAQSLTIGLQHPEKFAWVGGFSAAPPSAENVSDALKNPGRINHQLKLLWIGDGKDDFLLKRNKDFIALLTQSGIHYQWHLTDGNHSWPVWRNYLCDFAPELFR
jgi:enterochelin esterase-like enzyme